MGSIVPVDEGDADARTALLADELGIGGGGVESIAMYTGASASTT